MRNERERQVIVYTRIIWHDFLVKKESLKTRKKNFLK